MNIHPYAYEEWEIYPHVILTSDGEWDLTICYYTTSDADADTDNDDYYDEIFDISTEHNDTLFDNVGRHKHKYIVHGIGINNHDLDNSIFPNNSIIFEISERNL